MYSNPNFKVYPSCPTIEVSVKLGFVLEGINRELRQRLNLIFQLVGRHVAHCPKPLTTAKVSAAFHQEK